MHLAESKAAQPRIKIIHPKHAPKAPSPTPVDVIEVGGVPAATCEKDAKVEKTVEAEVEQPARIEVEKPVQIAEEPAHEVHEEGDGPSKDVQPEAQQTGDAGAVGASVGGEGVSSFRDQHWEPSPIRPEDTLGNYYYRSYTESRANEVHASVWGLKQGDTFATFPPSREWFLGLPPIEVLHQKKHKHEKLYQSHVFTQANQVSTSNQITREWRTMHHERAEWEDYRDRLATDARQFEKAKAELAELKAQFEAENKKEEWGLLGLKKKLQASEDTLVEERQKWRKARERNNQKMFDSRTEITNLKA
ncbi:hypothetical protein Hanom_Chr03g00206771 [Helianthus anomalus]